MRTRSLAATLAAAGLLAATAAGCGGSGDSDAEKSGGSTTTSTSTPTPTATTPTTSPTVAAPEVESFTQKLLDAMHTKKTAHMVINLGSSVTVDADVRYQGDTTSMKVRMTSGPTTADVIIVNGIMYIREAAGQKFTKVTKDTPGLGQVMGTFSNLGPEGSVRAMKSSIKAVKKAGSVKIDGQTLTKYVLTVDGNGIADQLGATGATANVPDTVTYFMYVDRDDLLRRAEMTISGQKLVLKVTNWGKPVEIKAPPTAQVAGG